MTERRLILEMGTGNDLHGGDYTKAAVRAVQDAMHHSYLPLFRSLDLDPDTMIVNVTVGVQQPEKVDGETVRRQFPYGRVSVRVVKGGLDVPGDGGAVVVASAAVEARLDIPDGRFQLSGG